MTDQGIQTAAVPERKASDQKQPEFKCSIDTFYKASPGWVGPAIESETQRRKIAEFIREHKEMDFAVMYLLEVMDSDDDE
jgi:hypothetical protein